MSSVAARSYTDAEVEAILRRAIEREQSRADGLGHDELLAAAREIGLPDLHLLGLLGAWVWWPAVLWGALLLLLMPRAFRAPNEDELEKAERRQNRRERRRLMADEAKRKRVERRERRHGP